MTLLLVLLGIALLVAGAEFLVRGASALSRRLGLSAFLVGVLVVAFGTSLPEFVVGLLMTIEGSPDTILGTIIGSNIANVFLILGLTATIRPIRIKKDLAWHDIPIAWGVTALLLWLGTKSHELTRFDGFIFLSMFAVYMIYLFHKQRKKILDVDPTLLVSKSKIWMYIGGGAICLFFGGQFLVENVEILARTAHISEILIGLTVIAIGTSLPELVTSMVASFKKEDEISIGNIVGSNILNVLWILGFASLISPIPFKPGIAIDIAISIMGMALLWVFLFVGRKYYLERWQGIVMLTCYITYIIFLVIRG